jgi:CBS domain-containing protein
MTRWRIRRKLRLEFAREVATMKVGTFCSTEVITAEVTDTLFEAAQTMARNHVGALAVLDDGALIGVISEADLVTAIAEEACLALTPVDEYMTEGAITVAPGEDAGIAARRMVEHRIGHLPVIDRDSAIGMVSKGDLLAVGAVAPPRENRRNRVHGKPEPAAEDSSAPAEGPL